MKLFRRLRDARLALTSLQSPTIELRTYAELIQAAPAPAAAADEPIPISSRPLLENDANH